MHSRLGDLLRRHGTLTAEQLALALAAQQEHGGALATQLVRLGLLEEHLLVALVADEYHLPVVDPRSVDIPGDAIEAVPHTLARRHELVPVALEGSTLTLSMVTEWVTPESTVVVPMRRSPSITSGPSAGTITRTTSSRRSSCHPTLLSRSRPRRRSATRANAESRRRASAS